MFKEEKVLIRISIILLIALSLTLYLGQKTTIVSWLDFFGINNKQSLKFMGNLFYIEHALFPLEFNKYIGILGFTISSFLLLIIRWIVKPKRKKIMIIGVALMLIGFAEMFLLDISIIGWLVGPMLIIAGFMLYRKSHLIF